MATTGTGSEITGVLLAGGRSQRMGRDKAQAQLGGVSLLQRAIARLRPQVQRIVISSNEEPAAFGDTCLPVVADTLIGREGPLAGLYAALEWARAETPQAQYVATVPIDTPFFPEDLVARLVQAADAAGAQSAIAASAGMRHPVAALWRTTLIGQAEDALRSGLRSMNRFADVTGCAIAEFGLVERNELLIDPFFNVNTPEDLAKAQAFAAVLDHGERVRGG
jgi:molybdopterin-guanine dinucleotide biosynthesis protein A